MVDLTVKLIGALPVRTTAQAPGGSSSVQDAFVCEGDADVDEFDDDASSAVAPRAARHAASRSSRPSRRALRALSRMMRINAKKAGACPARANRIFGYEPCV